MPSGDGTGPMGEGPLTGRAMGRCAGFPDGGYAAAPGRGGRGFRNRYYETGITNRRRYPAFRESSFQDGVSDAEGLRRQVQMVAEAIDRIAQRVQQLLDIRKGTD